MRCIRDSPELRTHLPRDWQSSRFGRLNDLYSRVRSDLFSCEVQTVRMWPAQRIVALAAAAVAAGAALGALYAVVVTAAEQFSLPSGPSFGLLPIVGAVGAILGAITAAAGAAGGTAAVLLTRRLQIGAAVRAVIAGSAAGVAALAATAGLFLRPGINDAGPLVLGSSIVTAFLAASGTWLFERRQMRDGAAVST